MELSEKASVQSMATLARYMALDTGSKVQLEYVWIGGSGMDLRCKTRTWGGAEAPKDVSELPIW